ncbi:nucleoside-diphosphate-sugar epimerase [Bacillus ectoiniformans]|uniref:SDR family NAD(P)-dependent oxidoreductase n=1 Tax=Bacillus ectoiniformans TaxID=1494429 RepID=UPI0019595788|nr:SDR family NAD(P)-dependent oxidoreductase [Bacillus ectoiniformans]MBM7649172.1 nucleoside-diphosphate-sugar epimerase [Bacillus ectoiniformans]
MKIIITGSTGFVGKKLMLALLENGHEIYPLVRSEEKISHFINELSEKEQRNVHPLIGNIEKPQLGISKEMRSALFGQIDIIYHAAAYLSFKEEDREQTFEANVEGTKRVLEFAKELNVKKFFHVSTAYTLGLETFAYEELHSCSRSFVNYYEESKCHAEHIVFAERENLDISIFRPAIIVGDSETGEAETVFALYGLLKAVGLIKKMADRGRLNGISQVKLLGGMESHTNFVPVNYVVDVLAAAPRYAEKDRIYHITNSNPPNNGEIFKLIKETSGLNELALVPIDYSGELTKIEQTLNEPMKVFHSYLSRSIDFDDRHTQAFLEKAGIPPLKLGENEFKRMMEVFFEGK